MSDPIRWRNDPSAPGSVRDLLSQARATPPMPPDVQASLAQELSKLGPPAPPTPSLLASKGALKAVMGLALAGVATWGGVKLLKPTPPPPTPIVVETAPTPAPIVEAPKPEAVPEPPPRVTPASPPKPVVVDRLSEEMALTGKAQGLIATDPAAALGLLEKHRRQFPQGQLAEEREWMAINLLAQLGRSDEQRQRAKAFLPRFPKSPHAARMREIAEGP